MAANRKIVLKEGWGYAEVQDATIKKKNGDTIRDSKGTVLLMLHLVVTDSEGNIGYVNDFVGENYLRKISNIENSFQIKHLVFNDYTTLMGKCAGCIIQHKEDAKYGVQNIMRSYVPLPFYNLMKDDFPTEIKTKKASVLPAASTDEDLDGLPF